MTWLQEVYRQAVCCIITASCLIHCGSSSLNTVTEVYNSSNTMFSIIRFSCPYASPVAGATMDGAHCDRNRRPARFAGAIGFPLIRSPATAVHPDTCARAIAFGNFAAARRHRHRRVGGPLPWVRRRPAGPHPRSRFARGRRDAGAPRQFADERDREDPRPGRRAPGSTPHPASPLPGGRRADGAARLPVRPSRAFLNEGP